MPQRFRRSTFDERRGRRKKRADARPDPVESTILLELMSPSLIPLQALLELRRLLDSMQSAEAGRERKPVLQEAASIEAAAPRVSVAQARRKFPQTEESKNELSSFQ